MLVFVFFVWRRLRHRRRQPGRQRPQVAANVGGPEGDPRRVPSAVPPARGHVPPGLWRPVHPRDGPADATAPAGPEPGCEPEDPARRGQEDGPGRHRRGAPREHPGGADLQGRAGPLRRRGELPADAPRAPRLSQRLQFEATMREEILVRSSWTSCRPTSTSATRRSSIPTASRSSAPDPLRPAPADPLRPGGPTHGRRGRRTTSPSTPRTTACPSSARPPTSWSTRPSSRPR